MVKKALNKIEFIKTGISKTRMGLGLAALGRPGYINLGHAADLNNEYDLEMMEKRAWQVLDRAWQLGVRYFDAARSYGRAEQFLASWLRARHINPDAVTVGSKWGYTYTADWKINSKVHEVKEHSLEQLEKQWQESREHLGNWLKLYQIHSATLESGVLSDMKVLNHLARLKSENIIIGLTLSGTQQAKTLEKALTIEIDGIRLFDSVQATWNLLETSAGVILEKASDQGMTVIIKEGLANGRLTERNTEADFKIKIGLLAEAGKARHVTIDAIALAGILKHPWAHVVLSGATTLAQLESNLKAEQITDLPDIDISEDAQLYWSRRSDMAWN